MSKTMYAVGAALGALMHDWRERGWSTDSLAAFTMLGNEQLAELETRRDALRTEADELLTRGTLDDATEARLDAIEAEMEGINKRHKQITRMAAVAGNGGVISGSGPDSFNINTRSKADPYDMDEIRSLDTRWGAEPKQADAEFRSRALAAIERDDCGVMEDRHKESATLVVERADKRYGKDIARYILLTGHPDYRSAFEEVLAHPTMPQFDSDQLRAYRATDELRTAMSLTVGNGGYLAPFLLDPSIVLTNSGASNPMRQIATVKTVSVNVWHGIASAGVTAEWIAEATEVADASPTFSQPTVTCFKADAYIQGSWEVIADTGISGDLGMLIADAKDRLEAAAMLVGTGSGQPTGAFTAIAGVTASRIAGTSGAAGAADFVVADLYAMQNDLPPRFRGHSSWVAEQTTLNKIRQFATGSGYPQSAFWADLGMNMPPQLLGRPVYEAYGSVAGQVDNTIVSGSNDDVLLLADFRNYVIADRIGITMLYEPLVKGSNRRPTGESAWVAYWRTGGNVVDGGAGFRLLRL